MAREPAAPKSARHAAYEVLLRVQKGAFLDALLGRAIDRLEDRREAALLTRLAYGVETWRGRLDWTIAAYAKRAVTELDPAVCVALRLGLFQLLFLDRVPAHAAVDTSVELAKATSPGGARLVNAVLRRVAREGERSAPDPADDLIGHLATLWSHPQWLVRLWARELGHDRTRGLLEANNGVGPNACRLDLRRHSREDAVAALRERGVVAHPSPYAPTALLVEGPMAAVSDLDWLQPQGVASQIVARMVAPAAGERVVDLCAAPGGKAAAMAEALESGLIVASDRAKGGVARTATARPGRGTLVVVRSDGTEPPFAPGGFDAALVDAPCSGLGTLRSHPEVRWRRQPEDLTRLAGVQRRLLESAAPLVRPGGRLVYATCTIVAEENDDVVTAFLSQHPGWHRDDPRPQLGRAACFVGDDGALRTSPDRDGLDGFFAVTLRNDTDGL